jgi:DNA mismatch repair ATPase MutL
VVSKRDGDPETWSATFTSGRRRKVEAFCRKMSASGTTVTALNFFYNMPVRQKSISAAVDADDVRRAVCAYALVNPGVAFRKKLQNGDIFADNLSYFFYRLSQEVRGP